MPSNYYELLNVEGPRARSSQIKSSYRQLSRILHPDKLQKYSPETRDRLTKQYVEIQSAYDALKSPLKRYVYDRFGRSGLDCEFCRNERDYIVQNLEFLVYYAVNLCAVSLMGSIGGLRFGLYWRYTVLLAMMAVETLLLFHSERVLVPISLFGNVFKSWTIHEKIALMHELWISWSIGLSQIGPMLFPESKRDTVSQSLAKVWTLAGSIERESIRGLCGAFSPFQSEYTELKEQVEKQIAIDLVRESLDKGKPQTKAKSD